MKPTPDEIQAPSSITSTAGWQEQLLFDGYERVALLTANTNCDLSETLFGAGCEILVLAGQLHSTELGGEAVSLGEGHWLRIPAGERPRISADTDTQLWVKSGYLSA